MRLIDADALKKIAIEKSEKCGDYYNRVDKVLSAFDIETFPTIEPEKRQGKWLYPFESTKTICVCSICGHGTGTGLNPYNYCPHCGADMRGDTDERDN